MNHRMVIFLQFPLLYLFSDFMRLENDNRSNKKHNYIPDNLSWTFLHSDDESLINSLKRDIEWM
jgi:hypothetical protein